jgi:hemolysin activation/secretion protein
VTLRALNRLLLRWTAALLGAATAAALAQTAPPGAVPTPEQLRPRVPPAKPGTGLPETPPPPRELGKPSEEITLDVSAYAVDASAPAELRAALPALTAPFVGKQRSYEDLVNAAAAVTRYLQRELGYYLGYAYLPEQKPEGGVIRIAVLEGRLDQVILNWPEKMPIDRAVVEAYLARLKPGEILRVRDVERIVFLVNDLRGITARFEVKSGRTPGTASLVVTPQPEERLAGRVEVDTLGSRYSGTIRASALAIVSSPMGRGDGLVLNALVTQKAGLGFGLAGYTLPVGSDGLKLGGSFSVVRYQLDKDELGSTIELSGDANALTLYALYPVIRSRNLNLFALASGDAKRFNDKQAVVTQKKRVTNLQLSVSGDARDDLMTGGVNTFEATLIKGKLDMDNKAALADNAESFAMARVNLSRLQNIVNNRLLLYANLKSQFAFKNLDNTEQFQLGGPERVRAFAPGEGTGDEGLTLSLELRFLPPDEWFGRVSREIVFSGFYDYGRIRFRHDPTAAIAAAIANSTEFENTATLSGWGIGAVWDRPRDFAFRAYLAWPASGTPKNDPKEKKPRVLATASKSF